MWFFFYFLFFILPYLSSYCGQTPFLTAQFSYTRAYVIRIGVVIQFLNREPPKNNRDTN